MKTQHPKAFVVNNAETKFKDQNVILLGDNEVVKGGNWVRWNEDSDAWCRVDPKSPFVGTTPASSGLLFARDRYTS